MHDVLERHQLDTISDTVPVMHQHHVVDVSMDVFGTHLWFAVLVSVLGKLLFKSVSPGFSEEFMEEPLGYIL